MQLFLTSKIWKEGKHYVAYNPELGVASQGKNFEHAQEMLREAIYLFLETSKDIGTLDQVLKESGFVKKLNKLVAISVRKSIKFVKWNQKTKGFLAPN